jgi:hypothetical protein
VLVLVQRLALVLTLLRLWLVLLLLMVARRGRGCGQDGGVCARSLAQRFHVLLLDRILFAQKREVGGLDRRQLGALARGEMLAAFAPQPLLSRFQVLNLLRQRMIPRGGKRKRG